MKKIGDERGRWREKASFFRFLGVLDVILTVKRNYKSGMETVCVCVCVCVCETFYWNLFDISLSGPLISMFI